MPFYQKGDVRIAYEESGKGFPLLHGSLRLPLRTGSGSPRTALCK
jgi:hypothetical protein